MVKNNKGITLIALVIMIIIIIILTSIFVATSLRALKETRISEIQEEVHALQQAISIRYTSYVKNGESGNVQLVGASPSSRWESVDDCINAIKEGMKSEERTVNESKLTNEITRDYDKYVKVITASEAKSLGVDPFLEDSVYVVDYYTSTAYGPVK